MKLSRPRLTVGWLMVAVAIFGLLVATIRSIDRMNERMGRQGGCYSCLNNIAMGLSNYSADQGRFPPSFEADKRGERKHSWRALFLPWFLSSNDPHPYDIAERWDGAGNSKLSTDVPGFLQCPSEGGENPHVSPFVMINDFQDTNPDQIPSNAILVLESWGREPELARPP